jgi:beta-glucosidase
VDPDRATQVIGNAKSQARADLAQRKSIVLLQNKNNLLPLPVPSRISLYTMGMNAETVRQFGYTVTAGDHAVGTPLPPIPQAQTTRSSTTRSSA